ncbi:MAG TPA: hypothetical protein ENF75_01645 [Acidilobales archaeon]|nr:MAG: hypothetical protein B6U85_06915 [Desulfurococcales archaeon ex4484_42]HDD25776.1 hypothetical protein [Acidilobales archaeon]
MADLLRAGARMLSETCPVCNSPLFRLRSGEVVCPIHGRVLIVKSESEVVTASTSAVLDSLETAIVRILSGKVKELAGSKEVGYEEARDIVMWLEALERIRRVKALITHSERRRS